MNIRAEIVAFMREYYDAGHIVNLSADVMAHKLADRIDSIELSIKEVYTHIDLVRVRLEISAVTIEPEGISICVQPANLAPRNALRAAIAQDEQGAKGQA